jgi:hypothetical protein
MRSVARGGPGSESETKEEEVLPGDPERLLARRRPSVP